MRPFVIVFVFLHLILGLACLNVQVFLFFTKPIFPTSVFTCESSSSFQQIWQFEESFSSVQL